MINCCILQVLGGSASVRTDSDESSNNSFDENTNNSSSNLDLRQQLQHLHKLQQLQQLQQMQGGRIALGRIGNSVSVIQKPVWRKEKPDWQPDHKPAMPALLPLRKAENNQSVELRQNFVILTQPEIKREVEEEDTNGSVMDRNLLMNRDPLRVRTDLQLQDAEEGGMMTNGLHQPQQQQQQLLQQQQQLQLQLQKQQHQQHQQQPVNLKRVWGTEPEPGKPGRPTGWKKRERGR